MFDIYILGFCFAFLKTQTSKRENEKQYANNNYFLIGFNDLYNYFFTFFHAYFLTAFEIFTF